MSFSDFEKECRKLKAQYPDMAIETLKILLRNTRLRRMRRLPFYGRNSNKSVKIQVIGGNA